MKNKLCNEINESLINKNVIIYGWVNKKIIFKEIIFIELRDCTGKIQIVFLKKKLKENFIILNNLTIESCIKINGNVKNKINDNKNNNNFEIIVNFFEIIQISEILPINLKDKNTSEEIKLKFRYLYLRKHEISNIIKIRSDIIWNINNFMHKKKFIYIETPILSKPTIEGAKNYIVKSLSNLNKIFALSQSPQIFKQMLMISGFNKYYQFAKCFRDEDLRKNRQPEFTQLDIESSFVDENYIMKISTDLIKFLFKKINNFNIKDIPKITYSKSIEKFGSDKPDFRNPLIINDLIKILIKNNIIINNYNEFIYIICIPIKINDYLLNKYKLFINDNKIKIFLFDKFNLKKYLLNLNNKLFSYFSINNIINLIYKNVKNSDFFLFIFSYKNCVKLIGELINKISNDLNLIDKNKISLVWINDFPMFKKKSHNEYESVHHPFTSPKYFTTKSDLMNNPEFAISNSYDLVLNGNEIASGSVRINNKIIQEIVFDILKISKIDQEKNFGFFLNALKYGTPNHAGIAFGLDRLIMIMTKSENIKDVIAFPKSTSLCDLMMNY